MIKTQKRLKIYRTEKQNSELYKTIISDKKYLELISLN